MVVVITYAVAAAGLVGLVVQLRLLLLGGLGHGRLLSLSLSLCVYLRTAAAVRMAPASSSLSACVELLPFAW